MPSDCKFACKGNNDQSGCNMSFNICDVSSAPFTLPSSSMTSASNALIKPGPLNQTHLQHIIDTLQIKYHITYKSDHCYSEINLNDSSPSL